MGGKLTRRKARQIQIGFKFAVKRFGASMVLIQRDHFGIAVRCANQCSPPPPSTLRSDSNSSCPGTVAVRLLIDMTRAESIVFLSCCWASYVLYTATSLPSLIVVHAFFAAARASHFALFCFPGLQDKDDLFVIAQPGSGIERNMAPVQADKTGWSVKHLASRVTR